MRNVIYKSIFTILGILILPVISYGATHELDYFFYGSGMTLNLTFDTPNNISVWGTIPTGPTFNSMRFCKGTYPTCDTQLNSNNVASYYLSDNPYLYYAYFTGSQNLSTYGTGNYWVKFCTAIDLGGDCAYLSYSYDSGTTEIIVDNPYYGDTTTRIDYIYPEDLSEIASSTSYTFETYGYLNTDDVNHLSRLTVSIYNTPAKFYNCLDVICGVDLVRGAVFLEYKVPLSGETFIFSTTTDIVLPVGVYYIDTKISKGTYCVMGYCLWQDTIVASSTSFMIATSTKLDKLYDEQKKYVNSLINSSDDAFSNCGLTNFNLFYCGSDLISWAFVPSDDDVKKVINDIKTNILEKPPFGYANRLYDILSGESTSTLPTMDIPIIWADSNNNMSISTTTLFQPEEILTGAGQILDDFEDPIYHKTFRDVFEPWVQLFISLMVILTIVADLLGSHNHKVEDSKR